MAEILEKILASKRGEVAAAKLHQPVETLRAKIDGMPPTRDFLGAIRSKLAMGKSAVIAEIKREALRRAGAVLRPPLRLYCWREFFAEFRPSLVQRF